MNVNSDGEGYGWAVFWGLLASGAVIVGVIVAIVCGFLLGHYTHVRTRTVAERTVTQSVATPGGTNVSLSSTSTELTAGATVDLPAPGAMVNIGAGLTGAQGLSATVWGQGPKNAQDVTEGPSGSVFVSTAAESGTGTDGVYLVHPGAKAVEVISGLTRAMGVVWHDDQLYVSSLGQVAVYTDFNGHGFGAHHTILTGLPVGNGLLGFNDELILGPDGRFYMGIASPCDHCAPTKPLSATIVSFPPDGSDLSVYAFGVRGNSSLAFLPGTSDLFMGTNQRENVGKSPTAPPDEFGLVTPGSDWGYPWCWQQGGNACRGVSHPLVEDDQHAATDGLTFVDRKWEASYANSALVSEWATGRVILEGLTIKDDVVSAHPQVILTNVGSPSGLMTLPNGSVLLASYATGKLYELGPSGSGVSASTSTAATSTTAPSAATTPTTATTAVPAGAIPISAPADGKIMFNTKTLTAPAGKDTFAFTNESAVGHNFTILKNGKVIGATPTFTGGVRLLTVTLAAGTYTFECTVPGHAQLGMKGTLTVT
ncbi:MAG TPA: plastocyanin/azurin family copper-binding protein [Solirubrobacteraceae bacterium]|nr:plastocyanin/azurin family copper-binding protein [Solirubrobacteraceae bacterium]